MYCKKGNQGWRKHFDFLVIDLLVLVVSFWIAYVLRHHKLYPFDSELYRMTLIGMLLIDLIVIFFSDSLKNILKRGYYQEFKAVLYQVALVELLTVLYLFAIQSSAEYSRITFLLTGAIDFLLVYLLRTIRKKKLQKKIRGNGEKRPLLILTTEGLVHKVVKELSESNYEQHKIAGIVLFKENNSTRKIIGQKIGDYGIVSDCDHLIEYIGGNWIEEVLVRLPANCELSKELINSLKQMGIVLHYVIAKEEDSFSEERKYFIDHIGRYTVVTSSVNYATPGKLAVKRMMDIVGGLVGCLITIPLYLVLAPLIFIQSPGRVIFSQERVGKNGKIFKLYKFRSMYPDAEERKKELMAENTMSDERMFKLTYDPRIIGCTKRADGTIKKGIGNFIRDWSLDEFPQFFNVLKGDMSLVGTRPPTVDEWETYDPQHHIRLAVKPGISGMWQVSGRSKIKDFDEVVKLDAHYIRNWSIGLDIKILLKTVGMVVRRDGAM